MVAGDGDRVPARQRVRGVGDEVGRESHRGARRIDVCAASDVLLEDVVLRRAADALRRHALLLGDRDVEREQDGRGRVDGHRRRHVGEWDTGEEMLHVLDARDGDADLADLADDSRVIRVVAHLRREVERDGEPGLSMREQRAEPRVRIQSGPEPGVLAHRPKPTAIHRRLHAARVRRLAWQARGRRGLAIRLVVLVRRRERRAVRRVELLTFLDALLHDAMVGRSTPSQFSVVVQRRHSPLSKIR